MQRISSREDYKGVCSRCGGDGYGLADLKHDGKRPVCSQCDGTGKPKAEVEKKAQWGGADFARKQEEANNPCPTCKGKRHVKNLKQIYKCPDCGKSMAMKPTPDAKPHLESMTFNA